MKKRQFSLKQQEAMVEELFGHLSVATTAFRPRRPFTSWNEVLMYIIILRQISPVPTTPNPQLRREH